MEVPGQKGALAGVTPTHFLWVSPTCGCPFQLLFGKLRNCLVRGWGWGCFHLLPGDPLAQPLSGGHQLEKAAQTLSRGRRNRERQLLCLALLGWSRLAGEGPPHAIRGALCCQPGDLMEP